MTKELKKSLLQMKYVILIILIICVIGILIFVFVNRNKKKDKDKDKEDLQCAKTEPTSTYTQGSSQQCLNSSAVLRGILTDNGVLSSPGDWLLIMKPGFNANCLKCCDEGVIPSKIHQVCGKENYVDTPSYSTLLEMSASSGSSFDGCKHEGGCYHYGYLSSAMSKEGKKELKFDENTCLTETNSLAMQTLMSCGPMDGYVCWNDQQQSKPSFQYKKPNAGSTAYRCQENFTMQADAGPDNLGKCVWGECHNLDAHDKGFIMFNKDIAVLCNHSCPSWPAATGGNAPSCFSSSYMANLFNQVIKSGGGLGTGPAQFILYTVMSAKKMDEIMPKAWTLAQVSFQDSYIPQSLQSVYGNTWKLLTTVFMQVPAQPSASGDGIGVECMASMKGGPPGGVSGSEYRNMCKYVDGVYNRDKKIKSEEDCKGKVPWCDQNVCSFNTSFGRSSCKANENSCIGNSNSWTNWQLAGKKGDYSAGEVQVWNVSSDIKLLSKSGYFLKGRGDTWTDVIAPVVKSNVIGNSWDMQFGSCYTSKTDGKTYSGADFSYFTNHEATSQSDSSRIKKIGCSSQDGFVSDHTKLCIATSNNWCAMGGLNRSKNGVNPGDNNSPANYSQLCRGTMFTLINDENLHNALRLWMNLKKTTVQNFKECTKGTELSSDSAKPGGKNIVESFFFSTARAETNLCDICPLQKRTATTNNCASSTQCLSARGGLQECEYSGKGYTYCPPSATPRNIRGSRPLGPGRDINRHPQCNRCKCYTNNLKTCPEMVCEEQGGSPARQVATPCPSDLSLPGPCSKFCSRSGESAKQSMMDDSSGKNVFACVCSGGTTCGDMGLPPATECTSYTGGACPVNSERCTPKGYVPPPPRRLPSVPERSLLLYNVYNGATEKRDELKKFIRDQNPTTLVLLELNGWNAEYFSDFGTKLGFSFSTFLNTKHGYHFGVLSNLDLKPVFSSARDPFHHGLIVLRDESPPVTTTMFVTHGDPRSAAYRTTEFNKVCTKIKSERDLGSRILVVGDLNSVSYIDDYDGDTFCSDKYLNRKFCMEGRAAEDGVIDYDPINVLKECTTPNLIDLGLPQDWTVPTPYGRTVSPEHATNLRLDYILASNDIHVTCTDTASWDNGSGYTCTRGYGDTVAGGPWCYYDSKDGGFTPGKEWTGGATYKHPEENCCICGKPANLAGTAETVVRSGSARTIKSDQTENLSDHYPLRLDYY